MITRTPLELSQMSNKELKAHFAGCFRAMNQSPELVTATDVEYLALVTKILSARGIPFHTAARGVPFQTAAEERSSAVSLRNTLSMYKQ